MKKVLAVFGATGNQGSSVIKAVLNEPSLSKEDRIRAIGRDASKPAMIALAAKGVETVVADMNTPSSLAGALQDARSVFLVTNFWESMSADVEFTQAEAVVDAAKANNVQHLIFSSLINVSQASGGRLTHVSHFDGKAKVEDYIRQSGLQSTFVLPGMFMSQFVDMIRKNGDGSGFTLALPVDANKARFPLHDAAADTGIYVAHALRNIQKPSHNRIYAAVDFYTPQQIVAGFEKVIGKPTVFQQLPPEVFRSFLPEGIAQELLENMLLMEDPGYYGGAALEDGPRPVEAELTTWESFVAANKEAWL